MEQAKDTILPVKRISPEDGFQYFFGYYDVPAWSNDGQYHLCHKVPFRDQMPEANDVAVIGMIRLEDGEFIPLTETTAWCFQQGAMLQWNPLAPNREIIFNRRDGDRFVGVIRDILSGNERLLEMPVANVASNGKYALSVSFSRMFDFRPGYGYTGIPDPNYSKSHPSDDGIFLVDMLSGKSRLILSLDDIQKALPEPSPDAKLLVNHIAFNTDGTRFMFLPRKTLERGWKTAMFTCDTDGSNLYCLMEYGMASHYHWKSPEVIVCWCAPGGTEAHLYEMKDKTREVEALDPAFFVRDGHCSYSPDRKWMLYDSYPIDGYRYLYLYDLINGKGYTLGAFHSPQVSVVDIRCDLHQRWHPSGLSLSFDSTHEGFRGVYTVNLESLIRD